MKYRNLHEAYLGSLADVYDNPDHIAEPRGQRTREKLNYQFTITEPTMEAVITNDPERNDVIQSYTDKETALYDSCSNRVEDFIQASKFWGKLANPDGTVNSAYGYLIWKNRSHGNPRYEDNRVRPSGEQPPSLRTPWEWAKLSLVADKDTRQAILRFSLPEHQWVGNKDQTCTLSGIFMIRENKLNLTIAMRSNDLTLGLVYDLPWFISLIFRMRDELKTTYPDLEIGSYTHQVHSLHIYDRDEEKILKMLGRK
jgi:thymidylate synthase